MALSLVSIAVASCKDSRRLPSRQWSAVPGPVTVNQVVLDEKASPRQVSLALLDLLKQCREIRSKGLSDPGRADQFDETRNLIRRLAAPEAIHELAMQDPLKVIPKDVTAEQAVEIFTNPWPSLVARYINGLARDSVVEQVSSTTNAKVTVRADSPEDRAIVTSIEKSLADQRGASGQPLKPGTDEFKNAVRDAAIKRGVVAPIDTQIELTLVRESGFWRVSGIRLSRAAAIMAHSPPPTTAKTPAS